MIQRVAPARRNHLTRFLLALVHRGRHCRHLPAQGRGVALTTRTCNPVGSYLAGRYRIVREIGSGGAATVFLAEDQKHARDVAVKVLRPELASALRGAFFLREIGIAAHLQHPHVVPLYDSGESDGLLYYVMPFVDGESLRARLSRDPRLDEAEAVRISREVALGLDYAHRRGLVHRDIKPDNICCRAARRWSPISALRGPSLWLVVNA